MDERLSEPLVVAAGIGYLTVLAWSMTNVSYDIWGALVVAPMLLVLGGFLLRRMFSGSHAELFGVMMIGLVIKLVGGMLRYWVSFRVYSGSTDAERYHSYGARAAGAVWAGEASWTSVLPSGSGTQFMERFTAFVYTFTGSSRMGAFFLFSWMAYFGVAFFVKAAAVAVPGLALRRYALIVVLAPSVAFWSSSIGKEAVMFLTLGIGTFGIAGLMARRRVVLSAVITIVGLGAALFVRSHLVGIWAAGLFAGMLVMFVSGSGGGRRTTGRRGTDRVAAVVFLMVAMVGLSTAAKVSVEQLSFGSDEVSSSNLSDILAETTRRTTKNGSTFVPPTIDSPVDWPYASIRTLWRPLPTEASGFGQLLAAAELTLLGGLYLVSWRRVINLPRMLATNPYVAFSVATLLFAGLAYSSFGNLGVLTRQKSLVFPFLLLLPCLPPRRPAKALGHPIRNSATNPDDSVPLAADGASTVSAPGQATTGSPVGRNRFDPYSSTPPRPTSASASESASNSASVRRKAGATGNSTSLSAASPATSVFPGA